MLDPMKSNYCILYHQTQRLYPVCRYSFGYAKHTSSLHQHPVPTLNKQVTVAQTSSLVLPLSIIFYCKELLLSTASTTYAPSPTYLLPTATTNKTQSQLRSHEVDTTMLAKNFLSVYFACLAIAVESLYQGVSIRSLGLR